MRAEKGFSVAILIFATSTLTAVAQPPDSLWSRTYGGTGRDQCNSVQQTSDGGYILAGITHSFGVGDGDFWLVKTDANGDSLWSRTFGGGGYDYCRSVQQTTDAGYILGGYTESFGAGDYDFWLVKTDTNGDSLWSRTFGVGGGDYCISVRQTTDSGYVLGGYTDSYGAGSYDFWLVKTDATGTEEWSRTFGGSNADRCYSLQQTSDGGYILGGSTSSYGAGSADFWLVKTDANGDSLWSRTFGGNGWDECFSLQQTTDGGYILGGRISFYGMGSADFWLLKTDASGTEAWSRTFTRSYQDVCNSLQQTTDGGYILGGYTWYYGNSDLWLVKTDTNGDSLWSCTFGGSDYDACSSVQQTTDGGHILGGYTESYGAGDYDFWLMKLGPELAVETHDGHIPTQHTLRQNWPNPFNPVTEIVYDLPRAGSVSLCVFDILGREVRALVDGHASAGSHRVMFDGSQLASGIYFYRLQAGDFVAAKKMVLLK